MSREMRDLEVKGGRGGKPRGLLGGSSSRANSRMLMGAIMRSPLQAFSKNPKSARGKRVMKASNYLIDRQLGLRRTGGGFHERTGGYN